ncbi:MAG: aspartyl protease family protein [Acetobacteraceae bacterium]
MRVQRLLLLLLAPALLAACSLSPPGPPAAIALGNVPAVPIPTVSATPPAHTVAACAPRRIASVPLTIENARPMLTARINGHRARLLLDTGSNATLLTAAAAGRLGLVPDPSRTGVLQGLGGDAAGVFSRPVPLALGAAAVPRARLVLGVSPAAFGPPGPWRAGPPDGALGMDFLSRFSVDLDLAGGRLALFSPVGCRGAVPAWCHPCLSVPLRPAGDTLLHVSAFLDGVRLQGVLDTGAEISALAATAARRIGLSATALRTDLAVRSLGTTGYSETTRLHRFASLSLGRGLSLSPHVLVLGGDLPGMQMLVGLNALAGSRLWIAEGSRRIAMAETGRVLPGAIPARTAFARLLP